MCNFTGDMTRFVLDEKIEFNWKELLISNYDIDGNEQIDNIDLRPYESRIYKLVLE